MTRTDEMKLYLLWVFMVLMISTAEGCGRRRRRSRPPPVNHAPSIRCPGIGSVTASSLERSAIVHYGSPTVSDDKGGWRLSRVAGLPSGSRFSEGGHSIVYTVTDSGGKTASCSSSFRVTVVRCGMHSQPTNGKVSCNTNDNVYGTKCDFSCEPGYWLDGSAASTCLSNGQNTHPTPVCKPKKCGELPLPLHSIREACTAEHYYKSICHLVCDSEHGYTPQHHNLATCQANTEWTITGWKCLDTEKPVIHNCPEGRLKTFNKTYSWPTLIATDNSGQVTLTQKRGQASGTQFEEGEHFIQFQASDEAGNLSPLCSFIVIYEAPTCAAPVSGEGDYDLRYSCQENYKVGSACQVSCRHSFVEGAKYVVCESQDGLVPTAKWVGAEGDYPKCHVKDCPDLKTPSNGAVVCDKYIGGQLCQIHCRQGFDVPHNLRFISSIICTSSGWSPAPPPGGIECLEQFFPDQRLRSNLYFYSYDCTEDHVNENIRRHFIELLKRNAIDSCAHGKCTIENVQVTCGPLTDEDDLWIAETGAEEGSGGSGDTFIFEEVRRKRRSIENRTLSRTEITFDLVIPKSNRGVANAVVADFAGTVKESTSRDVLNVTGVAGVRLLDGGNMTSLCEVGSVVANNSENLCVPCPRGTFHNMTADTCDLCPFNMFTGTTGQPECSLCPTGSGTKQKGGQSVEDCIAECGPGHYSVDGMAPCEPCSRGFFQPGFSPQQCVSCPSDTYTAEMGATNIEQCVSFDLIARGPVSLHAGPVVTNWVEDLTIAFWIKTLPSGDDHPARIQFVFSHPERGHQLTWSFEGQTNLTMRQDNVPVSTPVIREVWTHMALVWKGYPRSVDIYRSGKRVAHYGGSVPLCFLPEGTELTMNVQQGSGVMIKGLVVIPYSNTSTTIAELARSCSLIKKGLKSLLRTMTPSSTNLVSLVTPSACSEINWCDPNPCNGHKCDSFRYGFNCTCNSWYSGDNCEIQPDYCVVDNKCKNNASCETTPTGVLCECAEGFKGEFCQTAIVNGGWNGWTPWAPCSVTCGVGEKTRTRVCNNPEPEPELGKPCRGAGLEASVCTLSVCPECKESQLVLGHGVNASCQKSPDKKMNCSLSCHDGLLFQEDPSPYTCYEEVWVPAAKTISCVEVHIPDNAGFNYTLLYATTVNESVEYEQIVKETVQSCASDTTCLAQERCTYKVTGKTCRSSEGGCAYVQEGYTATVTFLVNKIAREGMNAKTIKTESKKSLLALNKTFDELEAMADCFTVVFSTGSVVPTNFSAANLNCTPGTVPVAGFCTNCAPGMYEVNDTCVECDKGWYQDKSGQVSCLMCPAATDTSYLGTIELHQCQAPPVNSYMLLTDPVEHVVWNISMATFERTPLRLPTKHHVSAVAFDPVSGKVYFADKAFPAIYSFGARSTVVVSRLNWAASVDDITVDPISRLIFYADKGNDIIGVISMKNKYHKTVVRTGTYMPRKVQVDPQNGVMYWIDWGTEQRIEKANYDGTGRQILVSSKLMWPDGLYLDLESNQLYWTDAVGMAIQVMNLTTKVIDTVYVSENNFPSTLTVFENYIFYSAMSDNSSSYLMRLNRDGTGHGKTSLQYTFASDICPYKPPGISGTNGCSEQNGGCSHICVPRPSGKNTCMCPNGYKLMESGVECEPESGRPSWWNVWQRPKLSPS